jgi:NADPH:quinone reductase-like Zn-dependent oxidoreductase
MAEHDSVVLKSRGAALVVEKRLTVNPGPGQLLIEVASIALNPVDHIQRNKGFNVKSYPKILGSDIAGVVKAVGPSMPAESPLVGDRVCAFAPSWWSHNSQDSSAFQKLVIVPAQNALLIPDKLSFNQAATLPMAVQTAFMSFSTLGINKETVYTESDKKAILIWGVGGSVGSAALQIALNRGFKVYGTASEKHHQDLLKLKNSQNLKLFDYKDKDVVTKISHTVISDDLKLNWAIEAAAGNLKEIVSILKKTSDSNGAVACAPFSMALLWYMAIPFSKISVKFVQTPDDMKLRSEFFDFVFRHWLQPRFKSGDFVPLSKIQIIPGGLHGIQKGLDILSKGVSGTKLVVEVFNVEFNQSFSMEGKNETILVFGATGATGKHFIKIAIDQGFKIFAVIRDINKIPKEIQTHPNFQHIIGSFTDPEIVSKAVTDSQCKYIACMAGDAKAKAGDMMTKFVTSLTESVRKEKRDIKFLYQAGAFSPRFNEKLSFTMKLMRNTIGRMIGLTNMLKDNDGVIDYLAKECSDISWIVNRPGMIKESPSEGVLHRDHDKAGTTVTFYDLARYNLDILTSEDKSVIHSNDYPTY